MDLHPIIVHFPVALLTVYALLECVRHKRAMEIMHAFHVKGMLVIIGALGAAAAYLTGPDQIAGASALGRMHGNFATWTLIVSLVIALSYLLEWWKPNKYSAFMHRSYVIIPLALILLALVVITGGLGGALVYGTHFDPFMAAIFKFLGVY